MPRSISIRCLILLCFWGIAWSGYSDESAVQIHVDPTGREGAAGSREDPLKTLAGACEVLREVVADDPHARVEVILGGGTYRLTEPLRLGPEHSPESAGLVRWRGRAGETPVISGGRPIDGWQVQADGSWQTSIPEVARGEWAFRELFVDGERRPRARHPSKGYFRIAEAAEDQRSWFRFREGDLPAEAEADGMELVFFHDWAITRIGVEAIDRSERILHPAGPIGSSLDFFTMTHWESHPRYWLENDPAFVDDPGEWHLDEENGRLTYLPKEGEEPGHVQVVAPFARSLLEIRGEPGNRVRNLRFEELHFAHAAWPLPEGRYWGIQATMYDHDRDGERRWAPSAIHVELAENCRFQGGRLAHLGASGIHLGSRTDHCTIRGMRISDIAGNGVRIGESRTRQINGESWWEAAPSEAATGNAVEDSVIEKTGQVFFGAVGIWVGLARETRIAHNVVRRMPYTGVSLGWMWNTTPTPARENRIEYNHIHHVMQRLSDGGGIYTLGRHPGSFIRGNWIHDIPLQPGRAEANGMFLDQGTTGFVLESNIIHDTDRSPLRWHQADENLVRNNILVHPPDVPYARYNATDPERITYKRNRIIRSDRWHPVEWQDWTRRAGPRPPWMERP